MESYCLDHRSQVLMKESRFQGMTQDPRVDFWQRWKQSLGLLRPGPCTSIGRLPPLPCHHLAWLLLPSSLLVTTCYLLHLLSCPSKTKTLNSRHTRFPCCLRKQPFEFEDASNTSAQGAENKFPRDADAPSLQTI